MASLTGPSLTGTRLPPEIEPASTIRAARQSEIHPTSSAARFPRGTRIATLQGEQAVETLRSGDWVFNAAGPAVRVADVAWRAGSQRAWGERPIRIHAGAFGPGQPLGDLVLQADHAVYLGGILIPLKLLVNGRTITREPVPHLSFWDVALAQEAILLAENVAAASWLNVDARAVFWLPGAAPILNAGFAADVPADAATEVRPLLEAVRRKLRRRADLLQPESAPAL